MEAIWWKLQLFNSDGKATNPTLFLKLTETRFSASLTNGLEDAKKQIIDHINKKLEEGFAKYEKDIKEIDNDGK